MNIVRTVLFASCLVALPGARSVFGEESKAPPVAPATTATPAAVAPTSGAEADLHDLVKRINAKLQAGAEDEAALAKEIGEFDTLLKKYAGEKTDAVAAILVAEGQLYIQVIGDEAKGAAILLRVVDEFPNTELAGSLKEKTEDLKGVVEAAKHRATLVGHAAPAIDFEWSTQKDLTSLSDLKGKVVILDFWATWCGPCVASFPEIRNLAEHYKGYDVQIVGVTSLQGYVIGADHKRIDTKDDPAKERSLLADYVKAKDMTWTVAMSKQPVFNPDYGVEGIPNVEIIAPDGTVRYIGLHPSEPMESKTARIDAILKEFGKKAPEKTS